MSREEAFGRHVKQLRLDRKLSLRKAAGLLGIGHVRLMELEDGKSRATGRPTRPRRETVLRLATVYSVPEASLLELAGFPSYRPELSPEELHVVETLRLLDADERKLAMTLFESIGEYRRSKES